MLEISSLLVVFGKNFQIEIIVLANFLHSSENSEDAETLKAACI